MFGIVDDVMYRAFRAVHHLNNFGCAGRKFVGCCWFFWLPIGERVICSKLYDSGMLLDIFCNVSKYTVYGRVGCVDGKAHKFFEGSLEVLNEGVFLKVIRVGIQGEC